MENFIESLADRPVLLVLSIMAFGAVFSFIALAIRELLIKLDNKMDPLANLDSAMRGYTGPDGQVDGVPTVVKVEHILRRHGDSGYYATFRYTVSNPHGVSLAVHRDGLLFRPMAILPPVAPEVPPAIGAAGYTLRFSPPELYPHYAAKLDGAAVFIPESLQEFSLEGTTLTIAVQNGARWPDGTIKRLAAAGAGIAKAFV